MAATLFCIAEASSCPAGAGTPGLRKDHFEYDARSKNGLAQFGHWTAALL